MVKRHSPPFHSPTITDNLPIHYPGGSLLGVVDRFPYYGLSTNYLDDQLQCQEHKLEIPTMYKAYFFRPM